MMKDRKRLLVPVVVGVFLFGVCFSSKEANASWRARGTVSQRIKGGLGIIKERLGGPKRILGIAAVTATVALSSMACGGYSKAATEEFRGSAQCSADLVNSDITVRGLWTGNARGKIELPDGKKTSVDGYYIFDASKTTVEGNIADAYPMYTVEIGRGSYNQATSFKVAPNGGYLFIPYTSGDYNVGEWARLIADPGCSNKGFRAIDSSDMFWMLEPVPRMPNGEPYHVSLTVENGTTVTGRFVSGPIKFAADDKGMSSGGWDWIVEDGNGHQSIVEHKAVDGIKWVEPIR